MANSNLADSYILERLIPMSGLRLRSGSSVIVSITKTFTSFIVTTNRTGLSFDSAKREM